MIDLSKKIMNPNFDNFLYLIQVSFLRVIVSQIILIRIML